MKKHKKLIIISLIVIVLIVVIVAIFIIKNKKTTPFEDDRKNRSQFMMEDMDENMTQDMERTIENEGETSSESKENKTKSKTTLTTTTEVTSALTENVELHATYYLEEIYVEENQFVASGENILKYTNGTYFVAPYDCYIIELNLPDLEGKVLNSHYVQISSSNSLMVTMSIDESNIDDLSIGVEATIEVTALGKTYNGNVTHIASTGNNGKFEIEIEFENDGDIMLGMTGEVSITI